MLAFRALPPIELAIVLQAEPSQEVDQVIVVVGGIDDLGEAGYVGDVLVARLARLAELTINVAKLLMIVEGHGLANSKKLL